MIKTGIVCDNYKLFKYREELDKRGFYTRKEEPFTKHTTTIQIECQATDLPEIQKICKMLEAQFKRRN